MEDSLYFLLRKFFAVVFLSWMVVESHRDGRNGNSWQPRRRSPASEDEKVNLNEEASERIFHSINSPPSLGGFYRSFLPVTCQNIVCLSGGVCHEEEDKSSRCLCHLGTVGRYCQQEASVKYPKFSGTGFIAFPMLRNSERGLHIRIEFKPEFENGVLLFTADQSRNIFDFFSIAIIMSRVEFRYDCGSGMMILRSHNSVELNEWNQVTVNKKQFQGSLTLNNGTPSRGKSKGQFMWINFRNELYLGGHTNLSDFRERTGTSSGLHGCVRSMQVNEKFYDMRKGAFVGDALRGIDVEDCSVGICQDVQCLNGGHCVAKNAETPLCVCPLGTSGSRCQTKIKLHVPLFTGSSFLQYTGLQRNVLSFTEIEVYFKPVHYTGLILYNGYAKDKTGDFLSLALSEGFVEYRFDLGTGPAILRSQYNITMNEWHVVRMSRTGRSGFLKVDDHSLVEGIASGAFTQLTLTLDLYLGGHRNFDEVAYSVSINEAFHGCIQKVVINDRPMKLIDEAITGANVDNCDHACVNQPCHENGKCIPDRDSYICSCGLGYVGDKCSSELKTHSEFVPSFKQNSFLLYSNPSIVQRAGGGEFKLQFAMKSTSSEGLLFWVSEEENGPLGDYLCLGLKNGFLHLSYNLGSGDANIVCNHTRVDDNRWHFVAVRRRGKRGELKVDGDNITWGSSPGAMTQLTTPGSIFIGGMEDLTHGTLQQYKQGFTGCLGNFTIGDGAYSFNLIGDAAEGANIAPCL